MAQVARGSPPAASRGYSNYVLGLLFVAYVFNFVDRQILSILLESIKHDLAVSDTAMGFLTGTAFALFYATLGVPIARWADVWVRRSIIALGLFLWSGMTVASGLARSFTQMAAARIGVGVGEAALSPPAHSLLADYFPPERRATALGIYAMGIHVGILVGLTLGGRLDDLFGWRIAFVAVGLPGVLLALLVRLTVREPERGAGPEPAASAGPAGDALPRVGEVFAFLWSRRSFRHLAFATALTAFAGYGFAVWAPAFLIRVHALSASEAGLKLGMVLGAGGAVGSVLAGVLADRLGRRDRRFWLWVPAIATLGPLPFTLAFFLHPDANVALLALLPGLVIAAFYQGPVFATVQTLAPPRMRSLASGILLFVINIIGLGLGPQTVGVLNDTVFSAHGEQAVRYSMVAVLVVMGVWGFVHFMLGARFLPEDLRRASA